MLGDPRSRARAPGRARWAPLAWLLVLLLSGCGSYPLPAIIAQLPSAQARPASKGGRTYAALGRSALATLEREYYNGKGRWNMCVPRRCSPANRDWGADSLTYALYLHWALTRDPGVKPIMNALAATSPSRHSGLSDVPLWDSIAASREYQVTGNPAALRKAVSYFGYVAAGASRLFALGACPSVLYQWANGGSTKLKTLETGANYIKAALLLYQITRQHRYLAQAEDQYQAVRQYFLSRGVPLYTVYLFDNGSTCQQVPALYYASVNGTMIWDGYTLAQVTGNGAYLSEAVATAQAVATHLGDATGVYADLQAENDVAEPLVEAMYDLAVYAHQSRRGGCSARRARPPPLPPPAPARTGGSSMGPRHRRR